MQQPPTTVRPPKHTVPAELAKKSAGPMHASALAHAQRRFRPPPRRFLRKLSGRR